MVRTRFAPSPTGYMHVGGARTALFAWLVARQAGGQFLLRIEDTDRARHNEDAEKHILESLNWLGLDWDGEIYRQSEHRETYKEWGEKLISKGRAYADPRSEDEIDKLRQQAKKQEKAFQYRNHRPQNESSWEQGIPLRFKSEPKAYKWHDEVMGDLTNGREVVDDFILIKSDGYPTYDFAHIIDDHLMKISHVMRSQEFASSIPKYLNLYEALEIERPKLATLPYVLAPDGRKKLSKREGAKDVLDYRKQGFLHEALVSFLATLGWNDGTVQEIFTKEELIKNFSLERVQKSGAQFDERRLMWVNGHFIRQLDTSSLVNEAKDFWPVEAKSADKDYLAAILGLVQERLKFFAELPELSQFFFAEPAEENVQELLDNPADKQLRKVNRVDLLKQLEAARDELSQSDFSVSDISDRLNGLLKKLDAKPGILFALIRIAISGQKSTPELFGTLSVLGKEKSLARIEKTVNLLQP